MVLSIPWLIIPVVLYFIIGFISGGSIQTTLDMPLIDGMVLMSGGIWKLTVDDLLITLTLIVLFVEILKSTRVSSLSLLDHSLSTLVFVACLVMFIVVESAATSTFFLIMVMTLIDVIAGFSITIRSARRDIGFMPPASH